MSILAFWGSLTRLGRIIAVVAAIVAAIALYLTVRAWFVGDIEVERDLAENQGGAAIESGQDAVNTIGENSAEERETQDAVEEVQNDVDQASDAAGADAAGRNGLCQFFGVCED